MTKDIDTFHLKIPQNYTKEEFWNQFIHILNRHIKYGKGDDYDLLKSIIHATAKTDDITNIFSDLECEGKIFGEWCREFHKSLRQYDIFTKSDGTLEALWYNFICCHNTVAKICDIMFFSTFFEGHPDVIFKEPDFSEYTTDLLYKIDQTINADPKIAGIKAMEESSGYSLKSTIYSYTSVKKLKESCMNEQVPEDKYDAVCINYYRNKFNEFFKQNTEVVLKNNKLL